MKLSAWAKKMGIRYQTAWRWFRNGKIIEESEAGGAIDELARTIGDSGLEPWMGMEALLQVGE